MIRVLHNKKISIQLQLAAIYSLEDSKIVTMNFFKSKVLSAIFLCLLTNLSIPKASASTGATLEYDVSHGESELIANHGYGHRGDCRQVKDTTIGLRFQRPPSNSNQLYRDKIIHEMREGERVILLEENYQGNEWILVSHNETDGDIVGFVPTRNLIECLSNTGNENPTSESRCRVTQSMKLYQRPNPNSPIITTIGEGARITISTETSFNSWFEVTYPEPGWIFLENNVDCESPIGGDGTSLVSSSQHYCFSQNINWGENSLPVYNNPYYGRQRTHNLPMNLPVVKTGKTDQEYFYGQPYQWVEITDSFGAFGWVANQPLDGQYNNIENLQPC